METKIRLSADEWSLVQDPSFLLTKNRVMEKMMRQFGELAAISEKFFNPGLICLPEGLRWPEPKISKGEQYEGLPYLMLDHPRIFSNEHILAVRTMFWWGHYFSVTLHLKGMFREMCLPEIAARREELMKQGYWWNSGQEEWKHQVQQPFYVPMHNVTENDITKNDNNAGYVKLARRIPLDQFESLSAVVAEQYRLLAEIIIASCQGGEKGLSPDNPKAGSGL